MKNIIIPVTEEKMVPFVESIKKIKELKIIVGVTAGLADKINKSRSKNFVLKIFEDGSKKEEIINSLKDELDEGQVLICRKEIEVEEVENFFDSSSDITICSIKRNKVQKFFFKLCQDLMMLLFGFNLYDGDISVICFGQKLFNVLTNIENLSYSSRVNKWKGVEIKAIDIKSPPAKKEFNKLKVNLMFYGWIALFVTVIASAFVYFYYFRGTFLTGLLYAFAILLAQIGLIIAIIVFNFNIKIGQRVFGKAKLKR